MPSRPISKKTRTVILSGKSFTYNIRRSRRAKRLLLRIDMAGAVELVVPWHVSFSQAERFVNSQAPWIHQTVKQKKKQLQGRSVKKMSSGELWPVFGDVRQLMIQVNPSRRRNTFQEKDNQLYINVNQSKAAKETLYRWYKSVAEKYFMARVSHFTALASAQYQSIVVSNAKSQWGSCIKRTGRISLNWRLALAPLSVTDYVIAHEVAHLKIANHSPEFWGLVAELYPGYKECRRWLKERGHFLLMLH